MSNTPYYRAENRLLAAIGNAPHDMLVARLNTFVQTSSCDVNRGLFGLFGIDEFEEEDD
jgi:hypothetical protein